MIEGKNEPIQYVRCGLCKGWRDDIPDNMQAGAAYSDFPRTIYCRMDTPQCDLIYRMGGIPRRLIARAALEPAPAVEDDGGS